MSGIFLGGVSMDRGNIRLPRGRSRIKLAILSACEILLILHVKTKIRNIVTYSKMVDSTKMQYTHTNSMITLRDRLCASSNHTVK
jgi:hypothetical protein